MFWTNSEVIMSKIEILNFPAVLGVQVVDGSLLQAILSGSSSLKGEKLDVSMDVQRCKYFSQDICIFVQVLL